MTSTDHYAQQRADLAEFRSNVERAEGAQLNFITTRTSIGRAVLDALSGQPAAPVAATEQAMPEGIYWKLHESDLLRLMSSVIGAAYVDPVAAAARCKVSIYPLATPADAGAGQALNSGLDIETILRLHDENTDRDFGLIVEPFARAIEREVLARLSTSAAPVTASQPAAQVPSRDDVRNEALEQAARRVEADRIGFADDDSQLNAIARDIRALKSPVAANAVKEGGQQ